MDREIIFKVTLPIVFKKRNKGYVSTCPILDVHSQGTTQREAQKNLKEALELFFVSCFERGTLDQVLKECGIKKTIDVSVIKEMIK